MGFRRVALNNEAPALPASSCIPLDPLEPDAPHLALRSLDTQPRGTRTVIDTGLRSWFLVGDYYDPTYPYFPVYPDGETARISIRVESLALTPGHVVGLDLLALPSGPTQAEIITDTWGWTGNGGRIEMEVTYRNSDLDEVTSMCSITPPTSEEIAGAIPPGAWHTLTAHSASALPWAAVPSVTDLERWTRGYVLADVIVRYFGGLRPVDVAVVERPSQIVVSTDASAWPSAMYVNAGQPYPALPSDYPIAKIATSDPGGGIESIRRALEQHGRQLGPCLAWVTSGVEGQITVNDWVSYGTGTGDDEAPPFSTTSDEPRHVPFTTGGPSSALPGFQLGGYARQAQASDDFLDGRTGVLPVYLIAYANAAAGVVQFRCGDDEWAAVELDVDDGEWTWYITTGWVEVGTCPESGPLGRVFFWESNEDTMLLRYAGVFYRQG